jgi:hypothetical protein
MRAIGIGEAVDVRGRAPEECAGIIDVWWCGGLRYG